MRGENVKPPYSAATITDEKGNTQYYVVPGRLITAGMLSLVLLIIITLVLGFLMFYNRVEIHQLQKEVQIEENRHINEERHP